MSTVVRPMPGVRGEDREQRQRRDRVQDAGDAEDGSGEPRAQVRERGERQREHERDGDGLERERDVLLERLRDVGAVALDVLPGEPRVGWCFGEDHGQNPRRRHRHAQVGPATTDGCDRALLRVSQAPTSVPGVADEPAISFEHVRKVYDARSRDGSDASAVDDLTLAVRQHEVLVLVGPSGCGKSTTLRMANRLVEPTSGRILLEGEDVTRVDPVKLRRRMGYVIQNVGLFPHRTVAQNVATVPGLLGWDRRRTAARVDELLDLVGLPPDRYARRYPHELSGGERQRVGVARALATDPPVLLMDEPFGAVDPVGRQRLQAEFARIQRTLGITVILVTHDIDEAVRMADRVAVLSTGAHIEQLAAAARRRGASRLARGRRARRARDARHGCSRSAASSSRTSTPSSTARGSRSRSAPSWATSCTRSSARAQAVPVVDDGGPWSAARHRRRGAGARSGDRRPARRDAGH